MKYTTLSGKEIILGTSIAKGGEGEVFNISNNSSICAKVYHTHIIKDERENKLKYMCANPPQELIGDNYKICWPIDVIYKNGEFIGYTMPKAFKNSTLPYHLCQPKIPTNLSPEWTETFNRESETGIISRLKLSTNIIAVINRVIRTKKYVLVDLKPQNILVTTSGKVSLIDLDSVQISHNENILFKAPVSTPEYTPTEAKKIIRSKKAIPSDWDMFSAGILIYEILCGIHPYVGTAKPPLDNITTLGDKIEHNLTYIVKGKDAFSVLPPPHKKFENYSLNIQTIFKRIFVSSSRPSFDEFGGILFNEVKIYEDKHQTIIRDKTLKKNKELKTKIANLKIKITENENKATYLYKKLEKDTSSEIKKLKKKNSKNNHGWVVFLIIAILISWIFFFAIIDKKIELYLT